MKKTIITMLSAVMLLGVLAAPAAAYQVGDQEGAGSNAANNLTQCNAVGGTFVSGSPNTCTITIDGEPVIFENAGNSENGWSIVEIGEVVVSKGSGPGTVTSVDVVEECYNPGGKLMKPGTGKCP